jgi:hypothetical protein
MTVVQMYTGDERKRTVYVSPAGPARSLLPLALLEEATETTGLFGDGNESKVVASVIRFGRLR